MFIEGFVDPGTGLMDNYGSGGCLFVVGASASASDADTVRISLVDSATLNTLSTQPGILHTDGTVSVTFPVSAGSYYLRVKHRNALESWSAAPVSLIAGTNSYDFSTAANKAYGSNMIQASPGEWAFYSGDISDANNLGLGLGYQDQIIEAQDYLDLENAVSVILYGYHYEDLTGDGLVEASDYLIMENAVAAIRFALHP